MLLDGWTWDASPPCTSPRTRESNGVPTRLTAQLERINIPTGTPIAFCLVDSITLVKTKLGVGNGGTTPDGRITLREVECLGSCGTAPAMLIDEEEMIERLDVQKVDQIVGGLK